GSQVLTIRRSSLYCKRLQVIHQLLGRRCTHHPPQRRSQECQRFLTRRPFFHFLRRIRKDLVYLLAERHRLVALLVAVNLAPVRTLVVPPFL
ncbi:unnamed protein product, partial [Ectocarpus sp. 13 AM-2016]